MSFLCCCSLHFFVLRKKSGCERAYSSAHVLRFLNNIVPSGVVSWYVKPWSSRSWASLLSVVALVVYSSSSAKVISWV